MSTTGWKCAALLVAPSHTYAELERLRNAGKLVEQQYLRLQREDQFTGAAKQLARLRELLQQQKGLWLEPGRSDVAARILIAQFITDAQRYECLARDANRRGDLGIAWDELSSALIALKDACRVIPTYPGLQAYLERLRGVEAQFPPQLFFSIGGVIKRAECSICGQDVRECDHIKGEVYDGEMAIWEIKEIDLREVSIVGTPANPRCRAFGLGDQVDHARGLFFTPEGPRFGGTVRFSPFPEYEIQTELDNVIDAMLSQSREET